MTILQIIFKSYRQQVTFLVFLFMALQEFQKVCVVGFQVQKNVTKLSSLFPV